MNFPQLANQIVLAHGALQDNAMRAVNQNITARNWLVGYWIVEFEQKGEDRANYGDRLLSSLAKTVKIKGLGTTVMSLCRKFYLTYPNLDQEIGKFLLEQKGNPIIQSVTEKLQLVDNNSFSILKCSQERKNQSVTEKIPQVEAKKLFRYISFTHFVELMSVDDPMKRSFYEVETIKGCWSVRELQRQMDSLCYERAGLSQHPEKLMDLTHSEAENALASNVVKSPYVFEFLGLKNADVVEESKLETLLMDHIQEFILELGEGFCFEARQKRILIDNEYFFVDLVFYHRVLKCHVLVELKTKKFNYADVAQLNMYVAYYREKIMLEDDNAPIGILLCTDAKSEMVKFATAGMDENLFVSKYLLQLPSKETFIKFLNNEVAELK